jgi:hypothetical protein
MTADSKLVPVELLRNIEMTWREASAFSITANNLIERGLPELRALLETPQSELAALREELAQSRILAADQGLNLKRVKREFDKSQQRLADAERRNATHESMLRHFASCADVRQVGTMAMEYAAALTKPEEAKS